MCNRPEYIERNVLIESFRNVAEGVGGSPWTIEAIEVMIERQEAADVVPAVHGRWVEKEEPYFDLLFGCSACGEEFCFIEGTPSDNLYKYCPHCGARMCAPPSKA